MFNWSLKVREAIGIAKGLSYKRLSTYLGHTLADFKLAKRPQQPLFFSFEPTTACNLGCPECPSGLKAFTRPIGKGSRTTFQKIISEWGQHSWICTFYFQGEPFINSEIFDMISDAKHAGLYTISSSNGHFFQREQVVKLAQSGLDKLIISLDGITPESYLKYRIGGDFDLVLKGLRNLSDAKRKGQLRTQVSVQFIVFSHNEHELPHLKAFMRQYPGLHLQIKTAQVYGATEDSLERLPRNKKYNRYEKTAPQKGCSRVEKGCVITWDGSVVPCCFDKDAENGYGNGNDSGFSATWNNAEGQKFKGDVQLSRSTHDICRNCSEGRKVWV